MDRFELSPVRYAVEHVSPTALIAFLGLVTLLIRVSWEARFRVDVTLALLGNASLSGVLVSFAPHLVTFVCVIAGSAASLRWQHARAEERSLSGALVLGTLTFAIAVLAVPAMVLLPLLLMVVFMKPSGSGAEGGPLSARRRLWGAAAAAAVSLISLGTFLGSGMWLPLERVTNGSSTHVGYILATDEYEFRMLDRETRKLANVRRDATSTHMTCHGRDAVSERLVRPAPDFLLHGWRPPIPKC